MLISTKDWGNVLGNKDVNKAYYTLLTKLINLFPSHLIMLQDHQKNIVKKKA